MGVVAAFADVEICLFEWRDRQFPSEVRFRVCKEGVIRPRQCLSIVKLVVSTGRRVLPSLIQKVPSCQARLCPNLKHDLAIPGEQYQIIVIRPGVTTLAGGIRPFQIAGLRHYLKRRLISAKY